MRLQTLCPTQRSYFTGTRVALSHPRRVQRAVPRVQTVNKTGHGTVLLDRSCKPRSDRIASDSLRLPQTDRIPRNVKHKWHLNQTSRQEVIDRPMTRKPCTPNQTHQNVATAPAPVLIPNRAFPFIKHAGEQAALGLHKPVGLVLASAYLLGVICRMSGMLLYMMPQQCLPCCACSGTFKSALLADTFALYAWPVHHDMLHTASQGISCCVFGYIALSDLLHANCTRSIQTM